MTFRPRAASLLLSLAVCFFCAGCDQAGAGRHDSLGARHAAGSTDAAASDAGTAAEANSSAAGTTPAGAASGASASSAPTGTTATAASPAATGVPAAARTAEAVASVPRPGADGVSDVTFDHLKFNIEKGQKFEWKMLTPGVEGLKGKRVRIRGWMLPQSVLQNTNIKEFVFVRDNQECCFGPGAALYDCMRVEMKPDQLASFMVTPITLEGTLVFDPLEFADMTLALFLLQDAVVR